MLRRLVAATIVIAFAAVALAQSLGNTNSWPQWSVWPRPFNVESPSKDAAGIADGVTITASLEANGEFPTIYAEVDYYANDSKEAIYAALTAGPEDGAASVGWAHIVGDSTAGAAQSYHTTTVAFPHAGYEGDVLHVVVRTWDDSDVFIEQTVANITLEELLDSDAPVILTSQIDITYGGNGNQLLIDHTSTFSTAVYDSLWVEYWSSYPSYGRPLEDHYQYKTAGVGVYEEIATGTATDASVIIPRAYHTDSLRVVLIAKDTEGRYSLPDTLYDGGIVMPIGVKATPNHGAYAVGSIELAGGDNFTSWWGIPSTWGYSEVAVFNFGQLLGTHDTETNRGSDENFPSSSDDFTPGWLNAQRAAGANNVVAVEHMSEIVPNSPWASAYQRMFRHMVMRNTLEDSMFAFDLNGDYAKLASAADSAFAVNIALGRARQAFAEALVNEWNHSDNRAPGTGFMLDVFEHTSGMSVDSDVYGTEFGGAAYDYDGDGTALMYDTEDQQIRRAGMAALLDSIRAQVRYTNGADIAREQFIIGANSDAAIGDTTISHRLDFLQQEDFSTGSNSFRTYFWDHCFHNTLDPTWTKSEGADYDRLFNITGEVPDPSDLIPYYGNLDTRFRTASGGPWIYIEQDISTVNQTFVYNEVFSLLFDHVYPMCVYEYTPFPRQFYHPAWNTFSLEFDNDDDMRNLGDPIGKANVDSVGSTWIVSRSFEGGYVSIQIANRANWDRANDDVFEYRVYSTVKDDNIRISSNYDPDLAIPPTATLASASYDSTTQADSRINIYASLYGDGVTYHRLGYSADGGDTVKSGLD
jgi:hypothetical protein